MIKMFPVEASGVAKRVKTGSNRVGRIKVRRVSPASAVANAGASIRMIRGHRVLLDSDLAAMYGVEVRVLNQAVRRNSARFPDDFMFQLTKEEAEAARAGLYPGVNPETGEILLGMDLRSQIVTSNEAGAHLKSQTVTSRSQSVILKQGQNIKHLPLVFTEQGVAMLSSVLRSPRAVAVNIEIMRAFVRLRRMLMSHADLAKRLDEMEKKYDAKFRGVFEAIRAMMKADEAEKPYRRTRIGFK